MRELTIELPDDLWARADLARDPFSMERWILGLIRQECEYEERIAPQRRAALAATRPGISS